MGKKPESNSQKKIIIITIFRWIFVMICIFTTILLLTLHPYLIDQIPASVLNPEYNRSVIIVESPQKSSSIILEDQQELFRFNEPPVQGNEHFFEKLVNIQTQDCYIASPIQIDLKDPPAVILYSHGSETRVTKDMAEQFMKDLRMYGSNFTEQNYIFAASNQHGENKGDPIATQDTIALYEYIKKHYYISDSVYLIGYSMGARVTMNYALERPDDIISIALLAPAEYPSRFDAQMVKTLSHINFKIWHGDKDVHVPLIASNLLIERFDSMGKEIEIEILKDADHWEVDVDLREKVLDYFNENISN